MLRRPALLETYELAFQMKYGPPVALRDSRTVRAWREHFRSPPLRSGCYPAFHDGRRTDRPVMAPTRALGDSRPVTVRTELRRHATTRMIASPEGAADAEMTGLDRLHPPYAAFVSAGAARAISKSCGAAAQDGTPITWSPGCGPWWWNAGAKRHGGKGRGPGCQGNPTTAHS